MQSDGQASVALLLENYTNFIPELHVPAPLTLRYLTFEVRVGAWISHVDSQTPIAGLEWNALGCPAGYGSVTLKPVIVEPARAAAQRKCSPGRGASSRSEYVPDGVCGTRRDDHRSRGGRSYPIALRSLPVGRKPCASPGITLWIPWIL